MVLRGLIRQRTVAAALVALMAAPVSAEVVVVVAEDSAVESLTVQQLADIFLGRREVLAGGEPIELIDQREDSRVYREFYAEYLERTPAQIKSYWSKLVFTGRGRPPRTAPSSRAVADLVARNPNTLGYIDRARVDSRLRVVPIEHR